MPTPLQNRDRTPARPKGNHNEIKEEQATQKHATFQRHTINGTNDPTPWPVTHVTPSGDTGYDGTVLRAILPVRTLVRITIPATPSCTGKVIAAMTRATESFAIRTADLQSLMVDGSVAASNNGTTAILTGGAPCHAGPVPHDGSDDGPAASLWMERQFAAAAIRGGRPDPDLPTASCRTRSSTSRAPRVLPG